MIAFAFIDASGYPTSGGAAPVAPSGAIPLPSHDAVRHLEALRYVDGEWVTRPVLPAVTVGVDTATATGLPDGAAIVMRNAETGDQFTFPAVGGAATAALLDDAVIELRVTGPLPYRPGPETLIRRGTAAVAEAARQLEAKRTEAIGAVNDRIARLRLRYVTDMPGQEALYLRKSAEGEAFLALDPEPADLTGFPLLAAEVGITAPTARDLALLWRQNATDWTAVAAVLEGVRMASVMAVRAAEDDAAIAAALDSLDATIDALPLP